MPEFEYITVIVGAGASVPYGLPTLAKLPEIVREFARDAPKSKLQVTYKIACRLANALWGIDPDRDWVDYEELLGVVDYLKRVQGSILGEGGALNADGLAMLEAELPNLIYAAIDERAVKFVDGAVDLRTPECYRRFLNRLWKYHENNGIVPVISCISLNYDCILDDEMSDHILGCGISSADEKVHMLPDYHVRFALATDALHLQRGEPYRWQMSNVHHLIKLHGSFDWLICVNCQAVHNIRYVRGFLSLHYPDKVPLEARKLITSLLCQICGGPLQHRLVAPILGKTEDSVARGLWSAAFRAIAAADTVYVIGYSFPPSDLPFRTLLQHALTWNKSLPVVNVIDPSQSDEFWSKMERIFPEHRRREFVRHQESFSDFLAK